MAEDSLRYDAILEGALRSVVRTALDKVAAHGLPGEHHFYITFRTDFPGVQIPGPLRARYPDEMTIVVQHRFRDLEVGEDAFFVTLSFSDTWQRLVVPFAAITRFEDPSVNFGLQFKFEPEAEAGGAADEAAERPGGGLPVLVPEEEDDADSPEETGTAAAPGEEDGKAAEPGKVVPLDRFRKK